MTPSTLFSLYLLSAFLVFVTLCFWSKRKGAVTVTTTLCSTCGERYLTKKGKKFSRCPQCGSLESELK